MNGLHSTYCHPIYYLSSTWECTFRKYPGRRPADPVARSCVGQQLTSVGQWAALKLYRVRPACPAAATYAHSGMEPGVCCRTGAIHMIITALLCVCPPPKLVFMEFEPSIIAHVTIPRRNSTHRSHPGSFKAMFSEATARNQPRHPPHQVLVRRGIRGQGRAQHRERRPARKR
jgi:hypothetical protein